MHSFTNEAGRLLSRRPPLGDWGDSRISCRSSSSTGVRISSGGYLKGSRRPSPIEMAEGADPLLRKTGLSGGSIFLGSRTGDICDSSPTGGQEL